MRCARRNPDSFSRGEYHSLAVDFHDGLSRQHVEELLRAMVKVPSFGRARWHALLNYAQLRILYQMPAVTLAAPDVMLGGCFADSAHVHKSYYR